tara:strand:+ start:64 stop:1287 length:1224 start_codon:yes stop_codon:yes gene_type:complete
MNIMEEKVRNEVNKASEKLGMEVSVVEAKYHEICKTNNLDPSGDMLLALSLFRQWFSGAYQYKDAPQEQSSSSGSLVKKAVGFFISVNEPMDMGARLNTQIVEEWRRDNNATYQSGRVALAEQIDGGFVVKRMFDGEAQERTVKELPANHHEVDTGTWVIPLDNIAAYGERKNPNYGKPLPANQNRMQGVFLGEVDGNSALYYFSYKGEAAKKFTPRTFKLVHFECIPDSNNANRIYGFKTGTLESLVYNSDMTDGRLPEPSIEDMQNYTMEHAMGNYSPLIDLNRYHSSVSDRTYAERFVITDGTVTAMNMQPNKVGSRRLTITDVNADYSYDGSWAGTTCWIPTHLDIDFGINSSVLVVGRTSQGRNDDGSMRDVSLNLSGILCTNNMGVVAEPFVAEEEDLDWF